MNVDNPLKSPAVLSICSGIRGLERGVERVIGPVRSIAYVEIEAFIISNLLAGMEAGILDPAPIWANLKTFPWQFFRGKVDILMGGYPCQPFSNAGKGLAAADPRHLWPYIESGIRTIRPFCCFFENVAAHLNKGYREVKWSLEEMGYVVKEGIYAAEEIGAPHQRERLFILAVLEDANQSGERDKSEQSSWRNWWTALRQRIWQERPIWTCSADEFVEKLADADSHGTGSGTGKARRASSQDEGEIQWEERNGLFGKRGGRYPWNGGPEVAHSVGSGQQEQRINGESIKPGNNRIGDTGSNHWPARPGGGQYSWEEPRTIEPGMGCTIDGHNFREDLLRALGNSVVEQQAEYAFRDLIRKHLKSLS